MLTQLKLKIAGSLENFWGQDAAKIIRLFEKPKSADHGQLALPVFALAKQHRKAPPLIATDLADLVNSLSLPEIEAVEAVSGFVNFKIKPDYLLKTVFANIQKYKERIGHGDLGKGKKLIIDYSSPNVAKPMHIGHLRATVIGQSLRNLAQTQGFEVVGLNHLGDWGSQFGKLCFAYKKWGQDFAFDNNSFEALFQLYVKFHKEAENDPELEAEGARYFKKLEEGDPETVSLWKKFIEISLQDFDKLWTRMGVKHDLIRGESFYNDRLKAVEKELEDKGLLSESEGAMVVMLDELNLPPCLIRKKDGASLYATRDLASALYRHNELGADVNLYVVGADQKLHFQQVFAVLKKMGYDWVDHCHHIYFGLVRFKDLGKISSRKGQIIRLSDVLQEAIDKVKEKIASRAQSLNDPDLVAEQVAMGAITFNDLKNERVKDVEFDWDQALSFDGDSGPYLQYVSVRCSSLLAKYDNTCAYTVLDKEITKEELELANKLTQYSEVLQSSYENFKPNILANYLVDLASLFNRFYHNHRVLEGVPDLVDMRVSLVQATQIVMQQGLKTLGIPIPSEM